MLKLKSLLKSNLFLFVATIAFLAVCPQDVWAAEGSVFEKVRDKAASSLKDIKLVVYILAGFGLIGFSFMAIFNKISWKWFANIAISLFLLSVMGLFIDDFTGTSKHSTLLDYGNYLSGDGSVEGTGGTIGGGQVPEEENNNNNNNNKNNSETKDCDNPSSNDYYTEYCVNLRNLNGSIASCVTSGGTWDNTTGTCSTGGGSSSGRTTTAGGASGTNQSSGTNGTTNTGSGNSVSSNNSSAQNNGNSNQNTAGNSQLVWDPETQSYMLPEVEIIGDKNLANNNPVSGLENIGGGAPNVDDLNKDLQNMVNNVNRVQGEDGAAGAKQEENNGGWLNDLWNKGKEEAKKKAEEETKKALEKAKQEALNAAKDKVNDVAGGGVLGKLGVDDAINKGIDSVGNKIDTGKVVDGAKDKFGWNEETSERNGQDNIGGALAAGKIPGTEGSAPDVNALNKDLQNIINSTGNSSASDYGWNEETSERNGYDAEPSQDIQPVWNPETQSYELPEVVVTGDASASRRPVAGSESSAPNVDALNKDLQNIVNGTGNSSASDYGWNEETSERNGYNADGTQGNSSASNYGWNEETSEGRGWGG